MIPQSSPSLSLLIASSWNWGLIPEWNQTTLSRRPGGRSSHWNPTISSLSFHWLTNTMNFGGGFTPLSLSTRSRSSILLIEYCISSTIRWMFGQSFECCMTTVFSVHICNFAFTLLSTNFSIVADTTWKGTWAGTSQQSWPSWAYSGWNASPHWLMQCPSSKVILNRRDVNFFNFQRCPKWLSLRTFSGLATITLCFPSSISYAIITW